MQIESVSTNLALSYLGFIKQDRRLEQRQLGICFITLDTQNDSEAPAIFNKIKIGINRTFTNEVLDGFKPKGIIKGLIKVASGN